MSTINALRYYFNPFDQTYSGEEGESCVCITLDGSKEFSPDELTEAIKVYGNWLALSSIDYQSRWIHDNKCKTSGAGQASDCSKHLSKEELEECEKMKQELTQQRCGGTHQGTHFSYIKDVDFMKRVLGCVRAALHPKA